jgi:superfamily II DNA or RNA helicase
LGVVGSARAQQPEDAGSAADVSLYLRHNDVLVRPIQEQDDPAATRALGARLAAAAGAAPLVYDRRLGAYRTVAASYRQIREQLEADRYRVRAEFEPAPPLPFTPRLEPALRPYQQEALDAWRAAGGRGVVVLPTGAGKTLVALAAVAHAGTTALTIVPTLDLLAQWRQAFVRQLGVPAEHVGVFGGGKREIAPITVMTYDSAAIHARELNAFGLIVFDEVHHLPASTYRLAAQGAVAPFRLGLSATPERTDGLDADLAHLVGPVVYSRTPRELRGHLARYREQRITIALSPEERAAYDAALSCYRDYVRRNRLRIASPEDFQRLIIWPSASNAEAREAMLAHRAARRLAFNAGAKLKTVVDLLEQHRGDRIIVFTEFNSVVDELSRTLLVPSITHKTPAAERAAVLDGFRSGRFSVLVTGRVLNEGVDVPDANVAIVLSGTATRREYVQRLGRILRPKSGPATLYELVTEESSEEHVTRRRHGGGKS